MATFGKEAIKGLRECRAAFKALPDITKEALVDAAEETAEQVRAGAVRRVPVRFGFLRDHIEKKVNRKTGVARVGVTKGTATTPDGKTVEPSRYSHLVEFGSVNGSAQPFMIPAAEAEREPYLNRVRKAGKEIERDTAAIGLRFL